MSEDPLDSARDFLKATQIVFCCTSSVYAVVVWDWIISLGREYRYVWRTTWTPVKCAYLFCRYWVIIIGAYLIFCFVGNHSLETCQKIYRIPVALAMWNQVGSESVLLIRTYAFFNRSKFVLAFLVSLMVGMIAYQLYVDASRMLLLPFILSPDRGPCLPMPVPGSADLIGFFIAPLLFDTIVTAMTVIKAVVVRRRNGGSNSRLIQTFIREGVFYYILISIANLINGIFYLQPRTEMSAINIPLSVMLAPVLACRLILDLRERGSETVTHSEGSGLVFSAKAPVNISPFTPPHRNQLGSAFSTTRAKKDDDTKMGTFGSVGRDVEMGSMGDSFVKMDMDDDYDSLNGRAIDLGSLSTAMGGEDDHTSRKSSFCDADKTIHSPTTPQTPVPVYRAMEMGFRSIIRSPSTDNGIGGIRVDIEHATASL
ncbi:hypothetical protein CYLTODRAFT_485330 [Cylindrobasidium torrendii FP15055 ss-10]|uniref:DUF6533 domain-containing protein n=1 Tax=Cylindrobasidium torrendii FP15055 ss-10 TaxID=1314674 RepID=A0A0D7BST9_9AGAR|nr:hypothetical protein CYLTODRAFT_485330 [Cylindrobasidium torrendii FP15055 ss-10]